jgi:hypothetical protein
MFDDYTKGRLPATEDPGDDSVVVRATLKWQDEPATRNRTYAGAASGNGQPWETLDASVIVSLYRLGAFRVYFLPIAMDGKPGTREDGRFAWALTRLDTHTWDVTPSVHFPSQLHGHLTLIDVPDPAPWASAMEEASRHD